MDEKYKKIVICLGFVLGGLIVGYYVLHSVFILRKSEITFPRFSSEAFSLRFQYIGIIFVLIVISFIVISWISMDQFDFDNVFPWIISACYIFGIVIGYFISIGYFPLIFKRLNNNINWHNRTRNYLFCNKGFQNYCGGGLFENLL